jgi:ribonuclease HII
LTNRILIGADEAGYGPSLGPLLIVATVWAIPEEMETDAFTKHLEPTFRMQAWERGCSHVPLGDSKQLYQPSAGLASLEAGLLAMLLQVDAQPSLNYPTDLDIFKQFVTAPMGHSESHPVGGPQAPWYENLGQFLVPTAVPEAEVHRLAELARTALQAHAIQLVGVRVAIITESEFNAAVAETGSKGQLLSATTLELVSSFCLGDARNIEVFCDRQGGRKNYLPILLEAMPNEWFVETKQSTTRCSYRNTTLPRRDFHFTVGGDSFGPTALASMLAKYLRERLMQSFNAFWQQHVPNLRPTAGYPLDAKRYRAEIEATARKLELPESSWWRCR